MKKNAPHNKVILALKRTIVDTFDDGKWRELGYLTDSIEIIESHSRLLRSLQFGDPDYDGNVLAVIPQVIGKGTEKLQITEEFVGLEQWLQENDSKLHAELYGMGGIVPLEEIEKVATRLDIIELNRHAARIRRGIRDDQEQAIGSAKELLETVLKAVLQIEGESAGEDIPTLLRRAQKDLDLDPASERNRVPGKDQIRRILSNLGQIVVGVAEVRNLFGTGHGRHRSKELEIVHARLVVNAAITIATFLVEVSREQGLR